MADTNSNPSPPSATRASASPNRDSMRPMGLKISELDETQTELMTRLQGLKQDLQEWKSKLDSQVKTYKEELTELKKTLNTDLEQLKSDFLELRITLQKQQEDITENLKSLGLEDLSEPSKDTVETRDDAIVSDKSESSFTETTKEASLADGGVAAASV